MRRARFESWPLLRRIALVAGLLSATLASVAAGNSPPVTDAECAEFGRSVAGLFSSRDVDGVFQLLDRPAFLSRVLPHLNPGRSDERAFGDMLSNKLPSVLAKELAMFTSARFLRVQHVDGEMRALLRLATESDKVNYLSFICVHQADGTTRWVDAFIYLSATWLSENARRPLLPLLADDEMAAVIQRLTDPEPAYAANLRVVGRALTRFNNGEPGVAWTELEQLPVEVRRTNSVLALRLYVAQALGTAIYLKVIEEWEAAYPNDPALALISIDGATLRNDYDEALKRIAAFVKIIGQDNYMDVLTADMLLMAGRYDEARTKARAALDAEPTLLAAGDALLRVSIATKNYPETADLLRARAKIRPDLDLVTTVETDTLFSAFRLTPQYREWIASVRSGPPKD